MGNITERVWQHPARRWTRLFAVAILVLFFTGRAVLGAGTVLGPVDGDGLTATDLERVKIGEAAPDFTLEAENGTPVTLSQFRGQKNVILVFYRGHW